MDQPHGHMLCKYLYMGNMKNLLVWIQKAYSIDTWNVASSNFSTKSVQIMPLEPKLGPPFAQECPMALGCSPENVCS